MASGGDSESACSMPEAALPDLPGSEIRAEHATGVRSLSGGQSVVASGIDPHFDPALLAMVQQIKDGRGLKWFRSPRSAGCRAKASSTRVLEFLLAHGATF